MHSAKLSRDDSRESSPWLLLLRVHNVYSCFCDTPFPPLPSSSRQHGVSYFNPQLPHWDVRMVPIEREAKERCSVLLFVISGDTLSVASMVEVAYYLGQGRNMVLCISDIPYPTQLGDTVNIEGMKVCR